MNTFDHTDIAADGWVARLPEAARPYALLARLDRPVGAWLLFLPGLWSLGLTASGARLGVLVVLFAAGSVLMRGAGCVVNDMWDRDLDRKVARTAGRPLAAGSVTMRGAAAFLLILLVLSLAILLSLNRLAQAMGAASLLLVATYPLAKRVTWWPQLMLGVTFGWGAPMGFAAGAGQLAAPAATLYAAAIVWILGYDTIYAHQDREDDALIGVRSTARLFAGHTRAFLGCCYAAMIACLAVTGWLAHLHAGFFAALIVAAGLLAWQIRAIRIDDPALCLRLFKANRDVGLVVALGFFAARL